MNTELARQLRQQRKTLGEIAEQCGVSRQRVHQKLGNTGYVNDGVRQLVVAHLDRVRRLCYQRGRNRGRVARLLGVSDTWLLELVGSRTSYLRSLGLSHCSACSIDKPLADFGLSHNKVSHICKACNRQRARLHYQRKRSEA